MRAISFSCAGVSIGVEQANRERLDAGVAERLQLLADRRLRRCGEYLPVVGDALVDLDDGLT